MNEVDRLRELMAGQLICLRKCDLLEIAQMIVRASTSRWGADEDTDEMDNLICKIEEQSQGES